MLYLAVAKAPPVDQLPPGVNVALPDWYAISTEPVVTNDPVT